MPGVPLEMYIYLLFSDFRYGDICYIIGVREDEGAEKVTRYKRYWTQKDAFYEQNAYRCCVVQNHQHLLGRICLRMILQPVTVHICDKEVQENRYLSRECYLI